MTYIFSDTEALMVQALKTLIKRVAPFSQPIHIGTEKKSAGSKFEGFQIIVRADGGYEEVRGLREEGFGINVFGGTNSENSLLARTIEALLKNISGAATNTGLRATDIDLSPTRVINPDSPEMQRYFTGTVIIGANPLILI